MSSNHAEFGRRLRNIDRRHSALSKGYATHLRKDGLVVLEPQRPRTGFPWKTLILLLAAMFVFKGFLLSNLGAERYSGHIERLEAGTTPEKIAAFVMKPEAATRWVAAQIVPFR